MSIRENRLFAIEDKVLSIQHIRELADIILQEYLISDNKNASSWIKFYVKCYDYSSFESGDISIFDDSSIINKKRVKSIVIEYKEGEEKHVKVHLNHGYIQEEKEYINDSDIEIGGNNPFWVSGIYEKINTTLLSFPEQDTTLIEYKSKINWLAFIIGTYFGGALMDFVDRNNKDFIPFWYQATHKGLGNFFVSLLAGSLFGGIIVWLFTYVFLQKTYEIWPTVELQIGPDHLLVEKKRRFFYAKLLSIVLIPLLLSIISTIITNAF
ncbi:MAG: hypothetical protein V4643_00105 [Bacteroidota bacterium]